jgi:hypothetical protein
MGEGGALRRGEDHQIDAQHDDLRAAALRRNPEIQPGMTLVAGMGLRKKTTGADPARVAGRCPPPDD